MKIATYYFPPSNSHKDTKLEFCRNSESQFLTVIEFDHYHEPVFFDALVPPTKRQLRKYKKYARTNQAAYKLDESWFTDYEGV